MNKTYLKILLFFLFISICSCKSKTELYLERGLDILSNKEKIDFQLNQDILISEIGVIRDQKEGTKTLVFKLNPSTNEKAINNNDFIGLRVWVIDKKGEKRIEDWDFRPAIIMVNNYKYILQKISLKENQIKRMKLYMYSIENGKKVKKGSSIVLHKINTYND